jgi:hypothetical protein
MRAINSILMRLAKRAEKLKPDHLVKSFVDVGPTYTLLSSNDNQIMFGRRGTGKTHFLSVLNNEIVKKGVISVPIDMRLIGSTGGIFSDPNIPQSERATRLLSDTLCNIHEAILDYILEHNLTNATEISQLLNEFIEQATAISIEGISEEEVGASNQVTSILRANIGLSTKGLAAGMSSSDRTTSSGNEKNKIIGKKVIRIHFGAINKLLNKIVLMLPNQELWVLIDEWSEIPLDLQPYVAELLRRILFPTPGITVKIAAIAHRCEFMVHDVETNISIGLELGSDASSVINLDEYMVFDNDSEAAKEFFKNLLHRHVLALDKDSICDKEANLFLSDVFSQTTAFDEFVRAAEGVPRDAINIISLAAQTAIASKISIAHIRKSAQKWFQINKHNALNSRPRAVALLDQIINEVIGVRKSRGFLISNEKNYEQLDYLYDMRIIHVLKQGVSAQNAVGKKYTLYSLDYGCYVELMSSKNAPLGLIIETDENNALQYIEVPRSDYRSVKNSILDLEINQHQARLDLVTCAEELQLPLKQIKTTKLVEKPIDKKLLNAIPENVGTVKVTGTIYIPIILVALVLRKAQGFDTSTATELTRIINVHIEININRPKIATNNMSRELRKDSTLNLEWLELQKNGRIPLFSLNPKWNKFWKRYFGKRAPTL